MIYYNHRKAFIKEEESMNKLAKQMLSIVSIVALGSSLLVGCGKKNAENSDVQKVIVGSGTSYNPYCYLDENGKAVGYEYAVLQEIDKLLPQYEFEYKSMNFDSLLLSLDSGKIDVAAHQYEYTDERAEKYLFGTEAYTTYITYIAVPVDDDTTTSLKDLAGKTVRTGGTTSATTSIVQKWNEENPDYAVNMYTSDSSTNEETVAAIKSGEAAATISNQRDVDRINKNFGNGTDILKTVGDPINNSKTFYLYRKDETELQKAMDGALKELKENGKLAELSEKYLGGDFTESE